MNIVYRSGTKNDIAAFKTLAVRSWQQFQPELTPDNWQRLLNTLTSDESYERMIDSSTCIVSTTSNDAQVIGMAFLVPRGNPTDIYDKGWSYIRLLTVDPNFSGQGIGRKLTALCVEAAKRNNEGVIALHTSELMDKARRIYERTGFKIVKELDQRLGKRYWLYTLELNKPE
jgi:ribosomal protein S18 acetylase RimI-like enzyme